MKSLIKAVRVTTLLSFVALSFSIMAAGDAKQKTGYVSTAKVMTELVKKSGLQKKIESEFSQRIEEVTSIQTRLKTIVENLQKNGATMTDAQRTDLQRQAENYNSTLQLKGKALQEDQRKRAADEEGKLIEKVRAAIAALAKKEGYDLIVDAQVVLFASDKVVDLSDKVIASIK